MRFRSQRAVCRSRNYSMYCCSRVFVRNPRLDRRYPQVKILAKLHFFFSFFFSFLLHLISPAVTGGITRAPFLCLGPRVPLFRLERPLHAARTSRRCAGAASVSVDGATVEAPPLWTASCHTTPQVRARASAGQAFDFAHVTAFLGTRQ
ncbi:ALH_1b_G0037870.mRNA.1.CDS.1 [Saccharomyces cerevisiae]|nr:ALH_1b_G0037870.mRNA.1.CDS.1 [Saccharomyces cerevisiae]CAI6813182.1 ALH_1b_G0037870.mRNA.1.CDS.1 [Saccharomyces cerevisiae]CAI6819035.1 AKR_collapsed_G0038130.mRNA.1.CDS.1 [Saccharomyces cerevisiae]